MGLCRGDCWAASVIIKKIKWINLKIVKEWNKWFVNLNFRNNTAINLAPTPPYSHKKTPLFFWRFISNNHQKTPSNFLVLLFFFLTFFLCFFFYRFLFTIFCRNAKSEFFAKFCVGLGFIFNWYAYALASPLAFHKYSTRNQGTQSDRKS